VNYCKEYNFIELGFYGGSIMDKKAYFEIDYAKNAIKKVGIGVLGYGFMGKVHSNAYLKIPYTYENPPAFPYLVAMGGRNRERLEDTAIRFGYRGLYTKWEEMVIDPDIEIFDNCTPDNVHCEPSIAAAENGKHVICEKPLSLTVEESERMVETVKKSGVKNMCCYNYRFIPAVRFAYDLIKEGLLGKIYQFRARYLQEPGHDPREISDNVWYASGTRSGVLLGIGCHIIDMARFLVGEIDTVCGIVKVFNSIRKNRMGKEERIEADEVNMALLEFDNGAIGTIESSGISTGHKNQNTWEINGSKGSIFFDLEDLNHLYVYLTDPLPQELRGFSSISVTDPSHPLCTAILPPGHNAGWEYGHVHAISHFIDCVVNDKPVEPYGATFEDGLKVQKIIKAINESFSKGKKVKVSY